MSIPAAYVGIIIIWSTTPLAIKWSGDGSGYLFGVTSRMLIGVFLCMLLISLLSIKMPWHKRAVQTYIAAGLAVYGAMLSVYWGAQFIPSGLISVLFGLTPFVTAVLAAIWLQERSLTVAKLVAMSLGISGLILIFRSSILVGEQAILGICAVLLSVFIHATSAVWVKKLDAQLPALVITNGALIVSTPLYLLTWWIVDGNMPVSLPEKTLLSIIYLGIFGSVLGFVLYYFVLKHIQASTMALVTLVTPVTALILGSQLNHEKIDAFVWAGTMCVMLALVIYQWGEPFYKRVLQKTTVSDG